MGLCDKSFFEKIFKESEGVARRKKKNGEKESICHAIPDWHAGKRNFMIAAIFSG